MINEAITISICDRSSSKLFLALLFLCCLLNVLKCCVEFNYNPGKAPLRPAQNHGEDRSTMTSHPRLINHLLADPVTSGTLRVWFRVRVSAE